MPDQITSLADSDSKNSVSAPPVTKVKTSNPKLNLEDAKGDAKIQNKTETKNKQTDEKINIAINGFGRIGRQFFKIAFDNPQINIVAVNDLGNMENLTYLLEFDTVYGNYNKKIETKEESFVVDGKEIKFLSTPDPKDLPWKDLNIDIVIESTGLFTSTEKAKPHLEAGAKRVVISAPAKDEETPTSTPNLNEDSKKNAKITSNGSCTTNAATPLAAILETKLGVEAALLNTVHGYTSTQSIVDAPNKKDFRRGRTAAQNIIPTSSGSAISTEKAVPQIKGKMDAMAMRVPVPSGSILDFTFVSKKETTVEEVNNIFKEASEQEEWNGILTVTKKPLVSSDILKNPHGSIVDLELTRVINGKLVKICAWYDNEWGYVNMLLKHVFTVGRLISK